METYRQLREDLALAAMALVTEFRDVPPGSVLRNFARAVRFARLVETTTEEIPQQAANITRIALGGHEAVPHAMRRGA